MCTFFVVGDSWKMFLGGSNIRLMIVFPPTFFSPLDPQPTSPSFPATYTPPSNQFPHFLATTLTSSLETSTSSPKTNAPFNPSKPPSRPPCSSSRLAPFSLGRSPLSRNRDNRCGGERI